MWLGKYKCLLLLNFKEASSQFSSVQTHFIVTTQNQSKHVNRRERFACSIVVQMYNYVYAKVGGISLNSTFLIGEKYRQR